MPSSDRLRAPARIGAGGIGRSGLIATGREYNRGRRSLRRSAGGFCTRFVSAAGTHATAKPDCMQTVGGFLTCKSPEASLRGPRAVVRKAFGCATTPRPIRDASVRRPRRALSRPLTGARCRN